MFGYTGKIGVINLTTKEIKHTSLDNKDMELFIGGKGLAAKIIFDSFSNKVEPFSNENMIVITTSPFTGSKSPSSSRFNISTISPLTGLLVSSNCGGNFGLHLKKAGYDGLIIKGKSSDKVYIDILDERIELKHADHLWGENTSKSQQLIGDKRRGKLVIGPAGENKVLYSSVVSEERVAGRGGVGAIFGYKNLKGIIASGNYKVKIFSKSKFTKHNQKWIKNLRKHTLTGKQLPEFGSAGLVSLMNYRNLLATKNYSSGSYSDFEAISGETIRKDFLIKNKGCVTCPIQCARVVKAFGKTVKGPELETLGLLGSNLLNNNLQNIINLNYLCDEYGIDTISFGSSIGFAMELNEKGLWNNGLNFGEYTELESLVKKVSTLEGIGKDLAMGTKRLADKYGGKDFAMNVKGLEIAAYEPRKSQGMGLGYATSNRGGCHLNGGYLVVLEGLGLNVSGNTTQGKAAFTVFFQDLMEAVSMSGSCLFTTYALLPDALVNNPNKLYTRIANKIIPMFGGLVNLLHKNTWLMYLNIKGLLPYPYSLKLITGSNMNIGKFIKAGERAYNLERLINIRQGMKSTSDTLPKRLVKELQKSDEPNSKVKLDKMLKQYYKVRGWNKDGIPTPKTLKRLNLK